MSRIAKLRETHLTREEIVATALAQFDAGPAEPTIRSLALELGVGPASIYHHYPSRAALVQGVVERVWNEATTGLLALIPDPFTADPVDVLVATGLSTRRAWLAHYRVARYMAATPEANRFVNETVGIMAFLFERMGLDGEEGAGAFHSYSSFMIGAVLFAADRKAANEQLTDEVGKTWDPSWDPAYDGPARDGVSDPTQLAFDEVMSLSVTDPARDEDFFEQGLRRLVEALATR